MTVEDFKDLRIRAQLARTVNIRFSNPEDVDLIRKTRAKLSEEFGFEVAWVSMVRGLCRAYLDGRVKVK